MLAIAFYLRHKVLRNGNLLVVYHSVAMLLMLAASFLIGTMVKGNIWLYNLNSFFTVVFIGSYFKQLLVTSFKKKVVLISIGINVFYYIIKNIVFQEFYLFDSVGYSMVSVTIVIYVFMYFHQVLKNITEQNILRQFNFWLASGYLIYFLGSFIIFLTYYYLTKKVLAVHTKEEQYLINALWGLHNVLLFIGAFSLLTGSLWLTYRKRSV